MTVYDLINNILILDSLCLNHTCLISRLKVETVKNGSYNNVKKKAI
jgi:hypothetical protein